LREEHTTHLGDSNDSPATRKQKLDWLASAVVFARLKKTKRTPGQGDRRNTR